MRSFDLTKQLLVSRLVLMVVNGFIGRSKMPLNNLIKVFWLIGAGIMPAPIFYISAIITFSLMDFTYFKAIRIFYLVKNYIFVNSLKKQYKNNKQYIHENFKRFQFQR